MYQLNQEVLRVDVTGMPLEWIDYQDAVRLYCADQVAYTWGTKLYRVHGGINAISGLRSVLDIHAIIATRGPRFMLHENYTPPLCNNTLFRRDGHLCLYCGNHFAVKDLSRDHVRPLSQGGDDTWANVVTACKRCNNYKAGRTPEQARMELLAVPFVPSYAEYVYLKGRRVLADQMEFLLAHFPRTSPIHARLQQGAEHLHRDA